MRYFVFTTKHHDGFCMFDTQQTAYKITDPGCPFHDDPRANVTKRLFDAFRAEGLRIGAYFSKPDWNVPWYWSPHWQHGTRNVNYRPLGPPRDLAEVRRLHARAGRGADAPATARWTSSGSTAPGCAPDNLTRTCGWTASRPMARRHQPGMLIVDRWVGGPYENYRTPEQKVPETPLDDALGDLHAAWRAPGPTTRTTSTSPRASSCTCWSTWSPRAATCCSTPAPTAAAPSTPTSPPRLRELGDWMRVNGEAIYATRPVAPFKEGKVCFTRRRDDGVVHAIYLPDEGESLPAEIVIAGVQPLPGEEVRLLGHPEPLRVGTRRRGRARSTCRRR